MKIRISHILKVLAVLLFVGGVLGLFIKLPIKPINQQQKELYASSLYQYLEHSGKERKAWVVSVNQSKDNIDNVIVKFFDEQGKTVEAYIPLVKQKYSEGDFLDILYNVHAPTQVRPLPSSETSLNWPLLGWGVSLGIVLYWLGSFRQKVSGGIE